MRIPMKFRKDTTASRVREALRYDPETGVFMWAIRRAGVPFGKPAGKLSNHGYVCIRLDRVSYVAHRLAWLYMTGDWPLAELDHRDGVRSNNRWRNLREATPKQNRENRGPAACNVSGVRGVSWASARGKWLAQIKHHGKQNNLGRYDCLLDAVAARLRAERAMFTHHREGN